MRAVENVYTVNISSTYVTFNLKHHKNFVFFKFDFIQKRQLEDLTKIKSLTKNLED